MLPGGFHWGLSGTTFSQWSSLSGDSLPATRPVQRIIDYQYYTRFRGFAQGHQIRFSTKNIDDKIKPSALMNY
jgi:hypothetical protein